MKKLILIAIAIFTLQVNAQKPNHKGKKSFFKDLTVEQIADLKTKKMTLHLDLTKVQQNKVYDINLTTAKERKLKLQERDNNKNNNVKKPDSNERYQHKMERLDKQIAHKKEMQSILDKEQFEKWEKMQMHRMNKQKKHKRKIKKVK